MFLNKGKGILMCGAPIDAWIKLGMPSGFDLWINWTDRTFLCLLPGEVPNINPHLWEKYEDT